MRAEFPKKVLRDALDYCPRTGTFTWRITTKNGVAQPGRGAGTINGTDGYVYIKFQRRNYKAHRLAWFFAHGEWPSVDIDHINRVRHDNRIENLRLATEAQNSANKGLDKRSKTGLRGVAWRARQKRYQATFQNKHLGYFETKEDAHAAALGARKRAHPEHST